MGESAFGITAWSPRATPELPARRRSQEAPTAPTVPAAPAPGVAGPGDLVQGLADAYAEAERTPPPLHLPLHSAYTDEERRMDDLRIAEAQGALSSGERPEAATLLQWQAAARAYASDRSG